MYLMMKHAFDLGYRRYEWKCDALNAASRRAAERLGFTFEGIFRQAVVYKGRNRDTAWYSRASTASGRRARPALAGLARSRKFRLGRPSDAAVCMENEMNSDRPLDHGAHASRPCWWPNRPASVPAMAHSRPRPHRAAPGRSAATAQPRGPGRAGGHPPRRPRIGLVLAGGGAKGGAHVGVLKVLEEMHIPIDCIAGTSMGALVGGGYASGIPAADLQTFLDGIDWPKVIGGQGLRELAPIEQKRAGVTYSNDMDLGLRDGEIIVPGGLVNTSGIDDLLRSYVAKARSQADFDKLPIPYRAVATDMVSGEMVVLRSGDLATAMRASMAIPGAFAPVHLDNYILNDGGMVRNLPIDVARDTCADVVIAVNLVTEPTTPDKLQTATQLAGRAMDVMLEANVRLQLQTLKAGDVRIDVQMGDIGTADFERVPETIPLGEKAARASAGELAKYSVPPEQYAAWRARVTTGQEIDARVAGVKFEGLEYMNPAYLATRTDIRKGDAVDNQRISQQAREMTALKDIDSVGYELTGDPKNPTLVWLPREKNWGPTFVQFDLGLYATQSNDSGFVLYMKTDRRWLNSLGLQWRNEIQLGNTSEITTSLYQPLDVAQRFFVEPKAFFSRTYENLYVDNERIANYRFDDWGGQMDFGVNFGTKAQVRLGYVYDDRTVEVDTGSSALPNIRAVDAGHRLTGDLGHA